MYDIYTGFRHLIDFRRQTFSLKNQLITKYVNSTKLTVINENCPLFSYFLEKEENLILLQQRGYLSEKECKIPRKQLVSLLVERVFEYNLHVQKSVIDSVNSILKPYESQLSVSQSRISNPPFRKIQNLVSVHIRYGSGGADFTDTNAFLKENSTRVFIDCISPQIKPNDFIFVASDSTQAKNDFIKRFGNRVITSQEKLEHSGVIKKGKKKNIIVEANSQSLLNALTDIIIASMASRFVGTQASTFSAMCSMLGLPETKYVGKYNGNCVTGSLYLPS